jgi:two-component system, OmpR family, response regulator ChvI
MDNSVAVIDDDPDILETLSSALSDEGLEVRSYKEGQDAVRALRQKPAGVAIVDIKMPGMDGLEVLRQLRKFGDLPIVFLTSKDAEVDELVGLRMGADDYIRKPVSTRLVIERVRSLLRRLELLESGNERTIHYGELRLSPGTHRCHWRGSSIDLTVTEFLVLQSLALHPGHVRQREQIMRSAYGEHIYVDDRTIDSHIKRLRRKFRHVDRNFAEIETLYGIGYRYREASGGETGHDEFPRVTEGLLHD